MSRRNEHRVIEDIECKRCCNCHAWKSLDSFAMRKSSWDGLTNECKCCVNTRRRKQRAGTWKAKPSRKRTRFLIECRCGCGTIIETPKNGKNVQFVKGHHVRIQQAGKYLSHLRAANEQRKTEHFFVGNIEGKICSRCKEWKSLDRFHVSELSWDGKAYRCKECQRKRALSYYNKNADIIAKKRRTSEYRKRFNAYYRAYEKRKRKTDIHYRLKKAMRTGLYNSLSGRKKHKKTLELLGCTVDELRLHLQEQFLPGMTWDNWGQPGWEIDHIIPISAFDLTRKEHLEQCFHYTNLQPLWGEDNLRKGNYVPERMKP